MNLKWSSLLVLGALQMGMMAPNASAAIDGTALLKQVDRNLNPDSYESYKKIYNVEPNGRKKEFILFNVKKGRDKVAALFLSPASEKGRSTLRLGDNMWLHIPNVGKPVRITSLQSIVGGVFNNADILSLDYSAEYNVTKVEQGNPNIILQLKAKTKNVAYDQLTMWVEPKRNIPVKVQAKTQAGMLVKTLYFKNVKDFGGGIVRPSVIETDSPLYKGYKSTMVFSQIKKRTLRDEIFTLTYMPRLESLR